MPRISLNKNLPLSSVSSSIIVTGVDNKAKYISPTGLGQSLIVNNLGQLEFQLIGLQTVITNNPVLTTNNVIDSTEFTFLIESGDSQGGVFLPTSLVGQNNLRVGGARNGSSNSIVISNLEIEDNTQGVQNTSDEIIYIGAGANITGVSSGSTFIGRGTTTLNDLVDTVIIGNKHLSSAPSILERSVFIGYSNTSLGTTNVIAIGNLINVPSSDRIIIHTGSGNSFGFFTSINGAGVSKNTSFDPFYDWHVSGVSGVGISSGTTLQRPTALTGGIRYNTTLADWEVVKSNNWVKLPSDTVGLGSSQLSIKFQDESTDISNYGDIEIIDFIGSGVTAVRSANKLTVTIPGGGGGGGSQLGIQFLDESVALGSSGTVDAFNSIGSISKLTRSGNEITLTTPNLGDNLQMTGGDPSNTLNVKIGDFVPNSVTITNTGKVIDLSIPNFSDTWNTSSATGKSSVIIFNGASPLIISSLLGGSEGKIIEILNISNTIILIENNSSSGSVSARFFNGLGRALVICAHQSARFIYTNSRWICLNYPTYDIFDDFTGTSSVSGTTWLTSSYTISTTTAPGASIGNPSRVGGVSIDSSSALSAAFVSESLNNKNLTNHVGTLYFDRFMLNGGSPYTNIRLLRGFSNIAGGGAGNWTTAGANSNISLAGANMIYYPDSGMANAATNWYFHYGPGTNLASVVANSVDSGIPIASSTTTANNLLIYVNSATVEVHFIFSPNGTDYTIVYNNSGFSVNTVGSAAQYRITGSTPKAGLDWLLCHNPIKLNR